LERDQISNDPIFINFLQNSKKIKMANNPGRLVCLCNHVTANEIINVLKAGAQTTFDVQQFTAAGTGCTRCVREINAIVEHHLATKKKDPQLKFDFEAGN